MKFPAAAPFLMAGVGAAIAVAATLALSSTATSRVHFADADDPSVTAHGAQIYKRQCASCHGRRLEGQALWQLVDKDRGRRAPAHDKTGHTWMHPDEDLFRMTKFGRFDLTPASLPSHMPAFESGLSDDDIVAAVAYIKARWPIGLRVMQANLNPGHAGMPPDAANSEWTLPATCISEGER